MSTRKACSMRRIRDVIRFMGMSTTRRWWMSFSIILLLSICWSLATPLFASPDETWHVIRAASVARGELLGRVPPHEPNGQLLVKVPAIFESSNNAACFAFQPDVTANCLTFAGSTRDREIATSAGRHPPFYYAVVGGPSLFFPSGFGVRLMRVLTALIAAALLASAVTVILSIPSRRLAALGMAVAVTPMALFLNGVVNPSSVEIAAGILLWTAGAVLVLDAPSRIQPMLVTLVGVASCTLALARQLGPLWLLIIGVILASLGSRSAIQALLRSRRFLLWVAAATASSLVQVIWVVSVGTLDASNANTPGVQHAGVGTLIRGSVGRAFIYFRELIGIFGWRDTAPPSIVLIIWTAAIGGIVVLAVWLGNRRSTRAIVAIGLLTFILPVCFEVLDAHKAGYFWQGRYTLPLAVGIPIIAAVTSARSEASVRLDTGRLAWTFAIGLGAAHLFAFGQALRRYTVGANGNLNFFFGTPWSPPVGTITLCIVFTLACVAWFAWLFVPTGVGVGQSAEEVTVRPSRREEGESAAARPGS